jgi:SAM-dependent methyltransferase
MASAPVAAVRDQVRGYYHRILPFYEQELADRGDAPFWARAAAEPPGCRVLELGAGTGRATAALAQTAAKVVACDIAPELIALARHRLAHLPHVLLLVADMRELELAARFDLVVAVDDPFVHLTDDEDRHRALATAARHLAPTGRLLLDAAWFAPPQRQAAGTTAGLILHRRGPTGLEIAETWRCDPETRLCTARFDYSAQGHDLETAAFPARLWSTEELEQRAAAANLEVTRLWGDYDGRPWDRATSPRLIAELRHHC